MMHTVVQALAAFLVHNLFFVFLAIAFLSYFILFRMSSSQNKVSPSQEWRSARGYPPISDGTDWPTAPPDSGPPSTAAPPSFAEPAASSTNLPPLTLPKAEAPASSSRERGLITFVGALILVLGAIMPSSPWVSWTILPIVGKRAYVILALIACLMAWRGKFRSVGVVGAIAAGMLLVTGAVSLIIPFVHVGRLRDDPRFFAVGWSWLVMLMGSILIVVASWFDMGASQDEQ